MSGILKKMTKADKALNILILIIAAALWVYPLRGIADKGQNIAIIEYKKQVLYTINLQSENGIYDFEFDDNTGSYEIKDGRIRLLKMPKEICPNSICSDTGWIQYPNQVIVCSPNEMIVKIEGSNVNQSDIDTFAY